ncbi:polysaccharide deacetylase family protein, partial [Flavobacteriaceae bacterium]|nr:polysaccharide deacetylase family protein [Flavobacteriaceae bacterium]
MITKKYLMIHADDSGLSWSENKATQQGMLYGSINSTSLMVPCPWFFEMAKFAIKNPKLDFGIHLTLTGEWKNYPFRPITPVNRIPSLVDKNGYFLPKRQHIRDNAVLKEVRLELINQIEFALSLGVKPSHLDSHMYTLGLRQDLLDLYQELGEKYRVPIILSK